ncbi:DEAD/DEAH box helicase [Clostridium gasigenes]|uniref:DEAD/DEAH box helicase n=1 Tax=Clostridium gasigenes TaxID=94869 RepID=UPI001C0E6485|nr:DEAD/DEAH box helicase [Clostridium gasigenes]MBU3134774.1 DEAD/DEAH box helicase [Clostridium gasigenes]
MNTSFKDLNLNQNLINGLEKQGITIPTDIQTLAIPAALENRDVIAESHTGSGKTLAFLTPIFEKVNTEKREMQALILAPTHELVMQIEAEVKLLAENSGMPVTTLSIIGDVNIDKQIKKIRDTKPHIIVGSPGRVLDLIRKKKITAHTIKTIVIDEADNLLDKNNSQVIQDIIKTTMRDRQLMIFSATVSQKTLELATLLMKEPAVFKAEGTASLNPNINHAYIVADRRDKFDTLRKLLAAANAEKSIVFVNNSTELEIVTQKLNYHDRAAFNISSHVSKEERQRALESFRSGRIKILVSSDLSARGLDIPGITHVFNLDFPVSANDYLHRAGRCARGYGFGSCVCIANNKEVAAIRVYEREFNIQIKPIKLFGGSVQYVETAQTTQSVETTNSTENIESVEATKSVE